MNELDTTQAAGQSSGVVLTSKGEEYCEAQRTALIRKEAEEIIEGCFDLIERMLRTLDRLDPDPEMEPSLGAPEIPPSRLVPGGTHGWHTEQGTQEHWADGSSDEGEGNVEDDGEAVNEDGGDILDEPHDANTSEDMEPEPCFAYPKGDFIFGGGSGI